MGRERELTVTPRPHEPRDFNAANQVVIRVTCNRRDLASQHPAGEAQPVARRGALCVHPISLQQAMAEKLARREQKISLSQSRPGKFCFLRSLINDADRELFRSLSPGRPPLPA